MMKDVGKAARIFLIDDHAVVRAGLRHLLSQKSYVICGEAQNRRETLEKIGQSGADLTLLDLSLGQDSGLGIMAQLREYCRVLVYSVHEDADTVETAFAVGADGYVSKGEMEEVLFRAVSEVLAGRRYVGPRAARNFADKALSTLGEKPEQLLSERETAILAMLARGESNTDIAAACSISVRTVETHLSRMSIKLRLNGRKELRRYAIQNIR
jgi:DNA-binding NarL/FixJ family response regulator